MEIKNDYLNHYYHNGFFMIAGYTYQVVPYVIDYIENSKINKSGGGICEIGVHHGKLYMALNCTVEPGSSSYAVDVFDDQELNIDKSGEGSHYHFHNNLSNLDKFMGKNTVTIQGDSTDTALDLVNKIGKGTMRYVSVDGGHTAEHAINDLKIAAEIVKNDGVVLLDDIVHSSWMGVVEGAIKYLMFNPTLVPFAIGGNKLWMCKLSYYDKYFKLLRESPLARDWDQKLVGRSIVLIQD